MQISESDLESSNVNVSVLLVERQMMTSLRSWVAHGARNFMFLIDRVHTHRGGSKYY